MANVRAIVKDESLTFAEKMLSIKSNGQKTYRAGEIAIVKPDLTMAQDSTGPLAIKVLQDMGIQKVHDPKKILLVLDHTYPAADVKIANLHGMQRAFAFKHGCALVEGSISHQHILEEYAVPGMMLVGADSHSCQAGAVGAFATGMGSSDVAAIWASGKTWMRVPDSFKINVRGKMKKGVFARDIIIHLIGELGEDGANYTSLEWSGETVERLSIASRACIANASMECSAKNSVFFADKITKQYLKHVKRKPMHGVYPGKNAEYKDEFTIEADKLEPLVAAPNNADNVKNIREVEGTPIDQAFLGSSTNARIEDLEIGAKIMKGRKVKTRTVITPASSRIYEEAIKRGLVKIFMEAGAVFTNSTCGACVGTHLGVLGSKEVCISSSPRNYVGRMGDSSSKVYLASPATVAASAVEGKIADPRKYLK